MLLDPAKRPEDWLAALSREAAATYGSDRAAELHAALERLSHALAPIAAVGPSVYPRVLDEAWDEQAAGGRRG